MSRNRLDKRSRSQSPFSRGKEKRRFGEASRNRSSQPYRRSETRSTSPVDQYATNSQRSRTSCNDDNRGYRRSNGDMLAFVDPEDGRSYKRARDGKVTIFTACLSFCTLGTHKESQIRLKNQLASLRKKSVVLIQGPLDGRAPRYMYALMDA